MSCHTMSNYIKTELQTLNTNPKMDVTTVKCLQTNKMIMTHNVRLIFTPINQTNKIFFISFNNLLNVTIQSHSTK